MTTPLYDELTEEYEIDPLEGIEYEELRTWDGATVARARVSPNVYDLPRYRATPEPDGQYWQIEQAQYIGQSMVVYHRIGTCPTEAEAAAYAAMMNGAE